LPVVTMAIAMSRPRRDTAGAVLAGRAPIISAAGASTQPGPCRRARCDVLMSETGKQPVSLKAPTCRQRAEG
jgi:hypothetical protein